MQILRLDVRQLRRFDDARFEPAPGINLITGDNGAGKTSLLEALHLMAYGRSFRGRVRDGLVRSSAAALEVFVEWRERGDAIRRAGLRHAGSDWSGRLDGRDVPHLSDLCAALAVVTFEPGSHALVTGGADHRRRYLDWGLFHVEQTAFLPIWRRYARALKQRNALLKSRAPDALLDAWDRELADAGEPLTRYRLAYLDALQPDLGRLAGQLAPMLGGLQAEYFPGWRRDEMPLGDALLLARERDRQSGHTSIGPHRADWRPVFGAVPGREALSRGQAKLTALAALLAQAEHFARHHNEWPVVALDDLASELDRHHQRRVVEHLALHDVQVWITGTEAPIGLTDALGDVALFHVEQGAVERVDALQN